MERDYSEATALLTANDYGCFDLKLRSKYFKSANAQADLKDAYLLATPIFGEEFFEIWLDGIETEPLRKKGLFGSMKGDAVTPDFLPVGEIKAAALLIVAEKNDQLPTEPCWQREIENAATSVMKSNNPEASGRYTFTTPYPEVIMAKGRRYAFHSRTSTRYDERFCYLKLVGSFEPDGQVEERAKLEQAIDQRLRAAQAGCVTGGGFTHGATFVDLLLGNLDIAVPIVAEQIRIFQLPATSWLIFLDSYWVGEWVGLVDPALQPPARPNSKQW